MSTKLQNETESVKFKNVLLLNKNMFDVYEDSKENVYIDLINIYHILKRKTSYTTWAYSVLGSYDKLKKNVDYIICLKYLKSRITKIFVAPFIAYGLLKKGLADKSLLNDFAENFILKRSLEQERTVGDLNDSNNQAIQTCLFEMAENIKCLKDNFINNNIQPKEIENNITTKEIESIKETIKQLQERITVLEESPVEDIDLKGYPYTPAMIAEEMKLYTATNETPHATFINVVSKALKLYDCFSDNYDKNIYSLKEPMYRHGKIVGTKIHYSEHGKNTIREYLNKNFRVIFNITTNKNKKVKDITAKLPNTSKSYHFSLTKNQELLKILKSQEIQVI